MVGPIRATPGDGAGRWFTSAFAGLLAFAVVGAAVAVGVGSLAANSGAELETA
jgi:hypothetical protein